MNNIKKELTQIANETIKNNSLKDITIQFKQVLRGRARPQTRKITVPIWAIQQVKEYGIYYIIHEITHFIIDDKYKLGYGHGELFKKIETVILRKYNIKPIYSKAYAKRLEDLKGNKLCGRYGKLKEDYNESI